MNKKRQLNPKQVERYIAYLASEEKSKNTIEKYRRDIKAFIEYLKEKKPVGIGGRVAVTKSDVTAYRDNLKETHKVSSINSKVVAINGFLRFAGFADCTVKTLKHQKQMFRRKEKFLTKEEYLCLIRAAQKLNMPWLALLMETLGSTGIRISELRYISVEAIRLGMAEVSNKGKNRSVIIPEETCNKLLEYAKTQGIKSGSIFISRTGKPLDRSYICRKMKSLCEAAEVDREKVFPHNLRHLFAITFYEQEKDLVALANILGHSSTETTRIYVAVCREDYEKKLNRMGLVLGGYSLSHKTAGNGTPGK